MRTFKIFFPAFLSIIIFCLCAPALGAQSLEGQPLIDSLLQALPKIKNDSNKVKLLLRTSKAYLPIDPYAAIIYADSSMHFAQQIKWKKGIGMAYMIKATIYVTISDNVDGLENAEEAYKIFKLLNLKPAMANALVEMGNSYEQIGNYPKAIEHNFNAISIYEEAGMDKDIANVYNNIGNDYYWLLDYSKAIENYKKAFELYKKKNDKDGIASALDNIGLVYLEQGDYTKANEYNLQAVKLYEEINDPPQLAVTYSIRGGILQKQKDFISALEFHKKAMAINKKFDIKGGLANNYGSIGEMYLSRAENETVKSVPASFRINKKVLLQNARVYFTEALNLGKETNELSVMMRQASLLSETEELGGNYKAALAWYKKCMLYKDSIFNDENKKKLAALETERLTEVKDKEIQLLNQQKAFETSEVKRQTLIKNIILGSVGAAALLSFLLIWSYNRRRKTRFDKQVMEVEMKALRAQMNPHFIFNSLHSINKYVIENDKENASSYLSKFSNLMRLILENSRQQEVPLEKDLQALELYMQLEALRFRNRFTYIIETDAGIDKENTLIPPLLLQPFVENAILHGIQNKESGLIKVSVHKENEMIKCIVEDNGTGRENIVITEDIGDKKRKSLGIKIINERLNIINKLKKVKAAINIFDLKDADNKPGGLRIELLLPLELAF